ncbi:single-stranded DNA-binding protein [Candidatus Peregrinibacteria bacterium CG22_combo_CG10-13_8_21_14_all_44_10]|nr:MAG: hypothetical protein AUK45_01185 [Candidatus Peregrinibacteria bacterium CG2_30_44_17]PIP65945.1 MAG: single-stranded DNA-binding protein [Candidatus Peregrinibacteria bacterium CG22_combo_CG10-13_8_21_14_all_44_10]PIS04160.1 MAG: single-stranded DNA-binding protein [Candidatus Peregrinibacteria bacterium CG10_big_fil_rev_8_21_14_0_10_44_7]PIX79832.1 MAG: single-stranded DNA-binding protein [Candidatus Peregrinibacteria bacterium CG_4_10_14_3_um_filter_44_21]PJB89152.1 MAG: single-stran
MRTVNKVILIGNLTRDPELKETQNGQKVVTFGVATNREWTTSTGDKQESAEFTECVAWSKLAEICASLLTKGKLVYVEGYLKTRSWDQPDGTKKHRTEVVVEDMVILEKRQGRAGGEMMNDNDASMMPARDEEMPLDDDLSFEG